MSSLGLAQNLSGPYIPNPDPDNEYIKGVFTGLAAGLIIGGLLTSLFLSGFSV